MPDFTGVPQVSQVVKQTGASTKTTVLSTFTYDQMYRLSAITQSYNGGTATQVAAYTYNEIGQMVARNLGQVATGTIPANLTLNSYTSPTAAASNSITLNPTFTVPSGSAFNAFITSATGYLQTVDYRYNIRGQVLSINNSKLSNDGGVTNSDNNDLFGMTFQYDQVDGYLNNGTGNMPSFDGKLTGIKWMARDGIGYERSYSITYDQLNRYTGETYAERTAASTGSFSNNFHGFDENNITYDAGGNLLTLTRNSSTEGTNSYTPIDNLTYTNGTSSTSNQPDQLYQVTDATGNPLGFNNYTGAGSSSHYVYDANGNLTNDPYKGLAISYNYLNRTAGITVNSTENIFYPMCVVCANPPDVRLRRCCPKILSSDKLWL